MDTVDAKLNKTNDLDKMNEENNNLEDLDDEEDDDDEPSPKIDDSLSKTVNSERLKAFNMFVRLFIDENLDRLVPISKQPKEKINAIIMSCQRQFPEFYDRARKRIRTYLKSCRRSIRLREPNSNPSLHHIPTAQLPEVNDILSKACQNESREAAKRKRLDSTNDSFQSCEDGKHVTTKKDEPATFSTSTTTKPTITSMKTGIPLTHAEVISMKALIDGYRQSASFLHRSADELERLLRLSQTNNREKQAPRDENKCPHGELLVPVQPLLDLKRKIEKRCLQGASPAKIKYKTTASAHTQPLVITNGSTVADEIRSDIPSTVTSTHFVQSSPPQIYVLSKSDNSSIEKPKSSVVTKVTLPDMIKTTSPNPIKTSTCNVIKTSSFDKLDDSSRISSTDSTNDHFSSKHVSENSPAFEKSQTSLNKTFTDFGKSPTVFNKTIAKALSRSPTSNIYESKDKKSNSFPLYPYEIGEIPTENVVKGREGSNHQKIKPNLKEKIIERVTSGVSVENSTSNSNVCSIPNNLLLESNFDHNNLQKIHIEGERNSIKTVGNPLKVVTDEISDHRNAEVSSDRRQSDEIHDRLSQPKASSSSTILNKISIENMIACSLNTPNILAQSNTLVQEDKVKAEEASSLYNAGSKLDPFSSLTASPVSSRASPDIFYDRSHQQRKVEQVPHQGILATQQQVSSQQDRTQTNEQLRNQLDRVQSNEQSRNQQDRVQANEQLRNQQDRVQVNENLRNQQDRLHASQNLIKQQVSPHSESMAYGVHQRRASQTNYYGNHLSPKHTVINNKQELSTKQQAMHSLNVKQQITNPINTKQQISPKLQYARNYENNLRSQPSYVYSPRHPVQEYLHLQQQPRQTLDNYSVFNFDTPVAMQQMYESRQQAQQFHQGLSSHNYHQVMSPINSPLMQDLQQRQAHMQDIERQDLQQQQRPTHMQDMGRQGIQQRTTHLQDMGRHFHESQLNGDYPHNISFDLHSMHK